MAEFISVHRRSFLAGGAGVLAAAACARTGVAVRAQEATKASKPLPAYVDWKNAEGLIVHSENTIETKREFIGTSGVTPNDLVYVRNNISPPDQSILANRDAWEVTFEGVANPRNVTLGELKTMGIETVAMVLQCSGNGRGFFEHKASGTPWRTGAAANVLWSGVPLRTVVDALGGASAGMKFLTSTGGETLPEGVDPKTVVVERSIPMDHALENAILAWEMNGEPISLAHGGPLRVITPGYYGVNNVKYVKRVALTAAETDASIQSTGYRIRPVGVEGAPDQPSMWEMKVKSWVTHPLADAKSGKIQIHGVAFGGFSALKGVEVSTDGGNTWKDAQLLGPDMGRYAWRPFVLSADLAPGTHAITSRATDSEGRVQEETTEPNHRGYDYSGWRRLAVEVTVA
ncbi:sulfite oxidase [Aestuariivirga sp.]|uniref:SorT family sulfite dehydrogenase catalytic subunit n=1 Tax=Aestuariivirga sp. TaxID=2650926 RepID=UPI003593B2A9